MYRVCSKCNKNADYWETLENGEVVCQDCLDRSIAVERAQKAELAGNHEAAAMIYEKMDMYEEAGIARAKSKEALVKIIDLNKLLQQAKDGGIVVAYRCPHCGGNLRIGKDTSSESLKICEHCGSEIKTIDLLDFLRTALS